MGHIEMDGDSDLYLAYLLRFWREDATRPWRATAVDPHTGEKHTFATPDQLWAFLQARLETGGLP